MSAQVLWVLTLDFRLGLANNNIEREEGRERDQEVQRDWGPSGEGHLSSDLKRSHTQKYLHTYQCLSYFEFVLD